MKTSDMTVSSNIDNMVVFERTKLKNAALETGIFTMMTGAFFIGALFEPNAFNTIGTVLCACSTLGSGIDMVNHYKSQEYYEGANADSKVLAKNMN